MYNPEHMDDVHGCTSVAVDRMSWATVRIRARHGRRPTWMLEVQKMHGAIFCRNRLKFQDVNFLPLSSSLAI